MTFKNDTGISEIISYLKSLETALLAYSGGVDSTLLLYLLKESNLEKVLAVTATSETYNKKDLDIAMTHTGNLDIEHIFFETCELENPDFVKNTDDRCYYCKFELFSKLKSISEERKIAHVLDATHSGDTLDHRPGMKAASTLDIRSPFKELGWDKSMIRQAAKDMGIDGWDRSATVCLASRIPYGIKIDAMNIARIGKAENMLKSLGLDEVRVRSDGIWARIEVHEEDIKEIMKDTVRNKIVKEFLGLGFKFVALDMEGFKTGKMNRMIGL